MIRVLPCLLTVLLWLPYTYAADSVPSAKQFQLICMSCHKLDRSPDMVAPPIFAVKNHYLQVFPEKTDFVKAVSAWLAEPAADRTLMPGALRRFKLMPPQPLPEEQRTGLAAYLFDTDFYEPGWYQEHYQQEHGNQPPKR